ncbi:MAG: FtsX-like permease family protein [Lentisphaerae bacterium]|jgi:putative ABC transport system permease protein|nr:FtsX-like permease family protein [Lentisphaerota bacterium]MBT4822146.1 FtsX-like permease family protein [Lentisphaerota bacterium]MBT5610712.1 FtsX-like permease family protein [Lentisphaerota bacterium]MBT7054281.1 FtsX-like permease family protein [Lentisphaerota bacterium]MBT7844342.1 FtsX-like permease family protein [Lentisphaerota bacterium]
MRLWRMLFREACHRRLTFAAGVLCAAVAVASLIAALVALAYHDAETQAVLERKAEETDQLLRQLREEMRKTTLKLSFNAIILPENQSLRDWHMQDYADEYMPEDYVMKLADSGIVTVRHFLPVLQRKVKWPERKQSIILVGTRGEVPNMHKSPKAPLVQPVPDGTIVLGHELHQRLGLKTGDEVVFMGQTFGVHRCHGERGTKDDITAWIPLKAAQELLDKRGKINAILALECLCVGAEGLARVRRDIMGVLPGTQVIEHGTKVIARAEARFRVGREAQEAYEQAEKERAEARARQERLAAVSVPLILAVCVLSMALLSYSNVRDRRNEMGILKALGYGTGTILLLVLTRALLTGCFGALIGTAGGATVARWLITRDPTAGLSVTLFPDARTAAAGVLVSLLLALVAAWIPALLASRTDPADILMRE